jgi:hypothetical protein
MSSYEKVWPKTFVTKAESETSPVHIFGGKEEDVWVASFADRSEAEAWMQGSSQFGQEVIGVKGYGAARVESGISSGAGIAQRKECVCQVQRNGTGGTRQIGELSGSVPLPSGNEVEGGN